MAIPSKKYWERRAAERMVDYTAEAEKTANSIGQAYYKAGLYLSDEAAKVVRNFGSAFDMSESEALRLLKNLPDGNTLKQLKAAVSKITDPDNRKELEAAISSPAYAYRIERMQALADDMKAQCKSLYGAEIKADNRFFKSLPDMAYKRTIFDIQKATGISSAFNQLPVSRVNRILSTKWSGAHFSDRVWSNTQSLADGLQHDILVGIMAGKSEVHMAEDIMQRMGVGAFEARRLVRTETTYIANQAELESYKETGLDEYEFSAHLDNRTSEICTELDGKVFKVKDAQPGTNLPPMHPFCRSSTVPMLPSAKELEKQITELGDKIGADVDFEEWKKHLVETEDGKLVYRVENNAETLDKLKESDIIEKETKVDNPILSSEQVIEKAKKFAVSSDYDNVRTYQELRSVTNSKLGYDGLPRVVSEDKFAELSQGKTIFYRGVKSGGGKSASEIVDEFKYGKLWTGNSGGAIYGNGVYFTETESTAQNGYAGAGGEIITAILEDNVKIADYNELYREYYNTGISKNRLLGRKPEDFELILADIGQYAAMKGYDAIAANKALGSTHDYIILLNRTKCIVKE